MRATATQAVNRINALQAQLETFKDQARASAVEAAAVATAASQSRLGSPRPSRQGGLREMVRWDVRTREDGTYVALNVEELRQRARPYWLTQEIGTGRSVTLRYARGAVLSVGVRPLSGRILPFGLGFVEGGQVRPAMRGRRGGIVAGGVRPWEAGEANKLYAGKAPRIKITRELQGKFYINAGVRAGYQSYSSSLRSLANQTLRG